LRVGDGGGASVMVSPANGGGQVQPSMPSTTTPRQGQQS
jgi:hypothetical protein